MATVSGTASSQKVTVTGSGYSGTQTVLVMTYTATNNRRRTCEMYSAPVVAGAVSTDLPMIFTTGTVVIKSSDSIGAVTATSTNVSV